MPFTLSTSTLVTGNPLDPGKNIPRNDRHTRQRYEKYYELVAGFPLGLWGITYSYMARQYNLCTPTPLCFIGDTRVPRIGIPWNITLFHVPGIPRSQHVSQAHRGN